MIIRDNKHEACGHQIIIAIDYPRRGYAFVTCWACRVGFAVYGIRSCWLGKLYLEQNRIARDFNSYFPLLLALPSPKEVLA